MSTITVDARVYLRDVISQIDTDDLLDELKERGEDIIINKPSNGIIKLESVKDKCKFEAIKEKFYDIPETDLDEFLSKY